MKETKDINFLFNEPSANSEVGEKKMSISPTKIIAVAVVVIIVIVIMLIPKLYVNSLNSKISELEKRLTDSKYAEVNRVKNELNLINQHVNMKKSIINAIDSNSVMASQALLVIEQASVPGCYLTNIQFSDRSLNIGIKAENGIVASAFRGNLDRLKILNGNNESMSLENSDAEVVQTLNYFISEGGENLK